MPQLAAEGKVPADYDEKDERTYHRARWFQKEVTENADGSKKYFWQPATERYWKARDAGDWSNAVRIYDDDQECFY